MTTHAGSKAYLFLRLLECEIKLLSRQTVTYVDNYDTQLKCLMSQIKDVLDPGYYIHT